MDDFFRTYTRAQQFLLLQAYADEVFTSEELLTFIVNETIDQRFFLLSQKQAFLVTPAVSLNDFKQIKLPREEIHGEIDEQGELILRVAAEKITLLLPLLTEAPEVLADINFLLAN